MFFRSDMTQWIKLFRIKYNDFALFYLLIAFFAPLFSALFPNIPIGFIMDALIVVLFIDIVTHKSFDREYIWIILLVLLTIIGMLFNLRYGLDGLDGGLKALMSSRIMFMFLVTIFFYVYTFSQLNHDKLDITYQFLGKIIKLNIAIILCEGLIGNIFDIGSTLQNILGNGKWKYQNIGHVVIFKYWPNGLIFGAQNASIISVVGVFFWFPWNYFKSIERSQIIWFIVSCMAFMLTLTGTSIICFLLVLCFFSFMMMIKERKIVFPMLLIVFAILIFSCYEIILTSKYQRVVNFTPSTFIVKYIEIFTQPIMPLIDNPLEAIIGSGNKKSEIGASLVDRSIIYTELGFVTLTWQYGLLVVLGIFGFFLVLFFLAIRRFLQTPLMSITDKVLRLVSICLVMFLSLIHYISLIHPGIMQLFSASAALVYVYFKQNNCQDAVVEDLITLNN